MYWLGINNIKIHFMTGRPSSKVFTLSSVKLNSLEYCEACKLAIKPNHCLTKNVYKITCSACGTMYIGETGRTIGPWIKEHLTMDKQTVCKYFKSHKNSIHKDLAITWKILRTNIRNHGEQIYIVVIGIKVILARSWMVALGELFVYRLLDK